MQPYSTDVNSPSDQATADSGGGSGRPFDPQLAAYDVLRRLVCRRSPFAGFSSEQALIPEDLKSEVDFGCLVYQLSVFLDIAKRRFGHVVSERIRIHLLLLAGFDPKLEAGLMKFLESIRAADAEFKAGRFSDLFKGPSADLTRYYAALAILLLIAGGCPEERQRALAGSVGECLLTARFQADDVFEQEIASAGACSEAFQWSKLPGPFERQLQRQHDNPLFPPPMRAISAQQITDARLGDLRRMSDFINAYRVLVREVLSPREKTVVKEASDLEKRLIDLIPSGMVLGDYFSMELKFLANVSDSIDQELTRVTKEAGLRDVYKRYMALTRIKGYLLTISVALPTGDGSEHYDLRSILSEEIASIYGYAQLCKNPGVLGPDPLDSVQRIINEAIHDGMDPMLGQRKLDAFRSGFEAA